MQISSSVSAAATARLIGQGLALVIIGAICVVVLVPYSSDPDAWVPIMLMLVAAGACIVGIVQLATGAARLAGKIDDLHRLYVLDRAGTADRTTD